MAIQTPGCCDSEWQLLYKILQSLPDISTGGGGSDISVSDEGVLLTAGVTSFNFVGDCVTATAVGTAVTVEVECGVTGPGVSVDGNLVEFNGVTGQIIADSGIASSSIVTNTTFQAGSQAIAAGVETISVVFGTAFAIAPVVVATMSRPVAENLLEINIDEASITVAGFTATISGITGSANYRLKWMAK